MKKLWSVALVGVTSAGLIFWFTRPPAPEPILREKESRRHPAPPTDLQAVNRHIGQSIAGDMLQELNGKSSPARLLLKGKSLVLVFFRHDCDCSLEFARYFAAAMEDSKIKADWYFVFPDTPEQIFGFTSKAGLPLPALRDPDSRLAQRLGIAKSGCFILVDPQGRVSAIWPGVSLEGLRDLFSRLSLPSQLPAGLSGIPQSPTAGCPL